MDMSQKDQTFQWREPWDQAFFDVAAASARLRGTSLRQCKKSARQCCGEDTGLCLNYTGHIGTGQVYRRDRPA